MKPAVEIIKSNKTTDIAILQKDIVIPAGTVFTKAPRKTERHSHGHYMAIFGLTDNTSGDVEYYIDPLDDAIKEWFRKEE
jgi:hypothetical protein